MVFVMAHMRRWKKESTIFKKAKKLFVVDVLHICAPSDGAMIGVLVYRFVPKEHALPQPGKNPSRHHRRREEPCLPPSVAVRHPEFRYKTEFQSHEPEFDDLKSLEIEEKINKIKWCQTANGALFLLSTNDKTIKFWKV
ncbi:hypothetical protein HN51_055869 [Arachis hypogaea]